MYQFLRLQFAINYALEVIQGKLKQFLENLDGIIVWGETKDIHDNRLKAFLDRAKQINLRFNKDICKFFLKKLNTY